METWLQTSLILCVFGFLKEFRPSEPFVTPYLRTYKNFTEDEVNQEIYPVGTYAYLALLLVVFLVTDLLRYKPVIILLGLSGVVTYCLLIWGTTIAHIQAVEVMYGVFMAAEVAYFTYMYAQVDKEHYQKVTSHTRTAFLLGRFLSGVVSQSLVESEATDYYQLNFITLVSESIATVWAFFLPAVTYSMYFHRRDNLANVLSRQGLDNARAEPLGHSTDEIVGPRVSVYMLPVQRPPSPAVTEKGIAGKCLAAYSLLWRDFTQAFTNLYVLKWSVWWALATCGFLQSITYTQLLWDKIAEENGGDEEERTDRYNGAIEAAYTLVGAGAAMACGWVTLDWQLLGELSLGLFSALQGVCLLVAAFSNSLWLAYCMYILFGVLYHTMITIASSEVAKGINEDSYALIFGVNTFLALVLQTILTLVVVEKTGLDLSIRDQFKVYGSSYLVMAAFFLALALFSLCNHLLCKATPAPENAAPKTPV